MLFFEQCLSKLLIIGSNNLWSTPIFSALPFLPNPTLLFIVQLTLSSNDYTCLTSLHVTYQNKDNFNCIVAKAVSTGLRKLTNWYTYFMVSLLQVFFQGVAGIFSGVAKISQGVAKKLRAIPILLAFFFAYLQDITNLRPILKTF